MNLKPRFLLLTASLLLVSALLTSVLMRELAVRIVEQWAVRYAEKQVLYDKARMLQPILREIALAYQFADSTWLKEWARDPNNSDLRQRALNEMESFRRNFGDNSYFVGLRDSGHYYHNNAASEYAGRQFRYTLTPERPADRWFYDIIEQNRDMHLNVNPDQELGVTKLWIDVLIRDGEEILGVAGTGLDLQRFIEDVVNPHEAGITSLFTNHEGAIQLHRDPALIDYASITKQAGAKTTLQQLLTDVQERAEINQIMQQLIQAPDQVLTSFVTLDGQRHLAGIAYLPEIDWYEVTLLDLNQVLPLSHFTSLFAVFGCSLLAVLLCASLALNRYVLRPLARLEADFKCIEQGLLPAEQPLTGVRNDEIGRLLRHFRRLANRVSEVQLSLEQKVLARTEALEQLTKTDALTGLLNRRGMTERLQQEQDRLQRERLRYGLLWLDVDHFKQINDECGHDVGDRVLVQIAHQIQALLRSYDCAARWGGDEFLILIRQPSQALLQQLAERLLAQVSTCAPSVEPEPLYLSLSAGSCLARPGETLEDALRRADEALYSAKHAGRRCYRAAPELTAAALNDGNQASS